MSGLSLLMVTALTGMSLSVTFLRLGTPWGRKQSYGYHKGFLTLTLQCSAVHW